jgi:hypothetical protein
MSKHGSSIRLLSFVVDNFAYRMENAQTVLSVADQPESFFLSFSHRRLALGLFGLGECHLG